MVDRLEGIQRIAARIINLLEKLTYLLEPSKRTKVSSLGGGNGKDKLKARISRMGIHRGEKNLFTVTQGDTVRME